MPRAGRIVVLAATCGSLGCGWLLGVDFDDVPQAPVDAGGDGRGGGSVDDAAVSSIVDAGEDAGRPATVKPGAPVCGDTSGLDPLSPWPMGGYCPTRAGRSAVAPSLATAKIRGRFSLPPSSWFAGGAALDGSGTAYVLWTGSSDAGYRVFLSAIRDQKESWRTDVTDPFAWGVSPEATTPVLAANGDIYLAVYTSLYAVRRDGSVRWRRSMGTIVGAPLVLGDGAVVVTAGTVRALDATGKDLWSYGGDAGTTFGSSVTASATGLLFAVTAMDAQGNASLHAFTVAPLSTRWTRPLRGGPGVVPLVDPGARVIVRSDTGLAVFLLDGAEVLKKQAPSMDGLVSFGTSSPPSVWFTGEGLGVSALDVDTGNTRTKATVGRPGGVAATRDGDLVFVDQTGLAGKTTNVRCWSGAGTERWVVPLDSTATPQDPLTPALGDNGTVVVPYADTLYVIGP